MIWNLFISIAIPLTFLTWLWTDSRIDDVITIPFKVVITFVAVMVSFIGIAASLYGDSEGSRSED